MWAGLQFPSKRRVCNFSIAPIVFRKTFFEIKKVGRKSSMQKCTHPIFRIFNKILFCRTGGGRFRPSETWLVNGSHVAKQTNGNIYSRSFVEAVDKATKFARVPCSSNAWKIGEPGRRGWVAFAADVMNFFPVPFPPTCILSWY